MPSSSPGVLATVRWAQAQGFHHIAVRKGDKAAVHKDYAAPDHKSPGIELFEVNDYNVGIKLGTQFGGVLDADLDHPRAHLIAPAFLPRTNAVFGRKSKPRSHLIYIIDEPEFKTVVYRDPISKNVLFELRADTPGSQTVFPGSLHKSGEVVEWNDGVPPVTLPRVKGEAITKAGNKLALALLIGDYCWLDGMKNNFVVGMSGMLFKMGWPLDDVMHLFENAVDFDRKSRGSINSTWKAYEAGENVAGSSWLKDKGRCGLSDELVNAMRGLAGAPGAGVLEDYNERFAVVLYYDTFRIANFGPAGTSEPIFMNKGDFIDMQATDYAGFDDNGKPIFKARQWLANPGRRSYDAYEFLPGEPQSVIRDQRRILNQWRGWAVEPDPEGSCAGWLELLRNYVCGGDDELYRWMLNWFASIVREPMRRPPTAPVVIGDQGAGKSLLFTYFGEILGTGYVPVSKDEQVWGKFNAHQANALLLHSEEALSPNDKKHAAVIRALITDPYTMSEPKNVNAKRVRTFMRVAFSSNDLQAAPAMPGDRRYTVAHMEKRSIRGTELEQRIIKELYSSGPAALLHFFLTMEDYDPQLVHKNLKTVALATLSTANMSPYAQWWFDRLDCGDMLDPCLNAFCRGRDDNDIPLCWPDIVSKRALMASCKIFWDQNNIRRQFNPAVFESELEDMLGVALQSSRRWFNAVVDEKAPRHAQNLGDRHPTFENMPDLDTCRAAYERFFGQTFEWSTDADDEDFESYTSNEPKF